MTLFFEVSRPFQAWPWRFSNTLLFRCGWAWFAFGWFRVPFHEYGSRAGGWVER